MNCLLLSKMRCAFLIVAFVVLAGLSIWTVSLIHQEKLPTPDTKALQEPKIISDLQSKWTVLAPQGQLWGFSPDQNVQIKIIEIKPYPAIDRVVVIVDLKAIAKVPPPPEAPKEQTTNQIPNKTSVKSADMPSSVELGGIAKLHYEKIGDVWYLLEVEGVSLNVHPH